MREYHARVALDVDAEGKVSSVLLPPEVPSVLVAAARETISHWRFKPPVRDGRAVTARTWATTVLQVVPQPSGDYRLRVVFQSNGPGMACPAPRYPVEAAVGGSQGNLVMEATAQPDGSLADIEMVSHQLKRAYTSAFEKSVRTALAQCQVSPELVDGKPVATRMRLPFVFKLHRLSAQEFSAIRNGAGVGSEPADDDAASPADQAVALNSPVQPLEPASWGAGVTGEGAPQPPAGSHSSNATPNAMR
ncbi:energy transducer TonB [Frateuria sp. GZRe12]|uniref:energy transducer TonB n=1 Tax=Frateuria sp. GZRe12 TaxID=3351533 RepID=UPI003EDCAA30